MGKPPVTFDEVSVGAGTWLGFEDPFVREQTDTEIRQLPFTNGGKWSVSYYDRSLEPHPIFKRLAQINGEGILSSALERLAYPFLLFAPLSLFGSAGLMAAEGMSDRPILLSSGNGTVQHFRATKGRAVKWRELAELAEKGAPKENLIHNMAQLIDSTELSPHVTEIFKAHLNSLQKAQSREVVTSVSKAISRDAEALYHLIQGSSAADIRRHTFSHFASLIHAVRGDSDRALLRSPTQTGKTRLVGLLWEAIRHYFPGKIALVVVPNRDILTQHRDLLMRIAPGLRVGLLDGGHKDVDPDRFDVVIAVMPSLRKHYNSFPPDRVGMVIVDEAMFSLARTWQEMLKFYGFLYENGTIKRAGGRFLLGLTADPYSISQVFGGGSSIISPPVKWFEDEKYLHKLTGVIWQYPEGTMFAKEVSGEDEGDRTGWELVPKKSSVLAEGALNVYRRYGRGDKAIVYTMRVDQAVAAASLLNEKYGDGYALAIHGGMRQRAVDREVKRFNEGTGAKVLCLVGKCSQGTTLQGVRTIIHTNPGMSMRRYGQRVGRPLGINEGEEQRKILNVDMLPPWGDPDRFVTLLRHRGIIDNVPLGIEYDPRELSERIGTPGGKRRINLYVPKLSMRIGITFRPVGMTEGISRFGGELSHLLREAMVRDFEGDPYSMADALSMDIDLLDRYLNGALPKSALDAKEMAHKTGNSEKLWVAAWEKDALDAIEHLYPLSDDVGEYLKELVMLTRRVTLHLAGLNPVLYALNRVGITDVRSYHVWLDVYSGSLSRLPKRFDGTYVDVLRRILTVPQLVDPAIIHPVAVGILLEDVRDEFAQRDVVDPLIPVGAAGDVEIVAAALSFGENPDVIADLSGLPDGDDNEAMVEQFAMRLNDGSWNGWPVSTEATDADPALQAQFDRLDAALQKISPREEKVVRMRHLEGENANTYGEIGALFGVTGSRVQQIDRRALRRLRHPSFWRRSVQEPVLVQPMSLAKDMSNHSLDLAERLGQAGVSAEVRPLLEAVRARAKSLGYYFIPSDALEGSPFKAQAPIALDHPVNRFLMYGDITFPGRYSVHAFIRDLVRTHLIDASDSKVLDVITDLFVRFAGWAPLSQVHEPHRVLTQALRRQYIAFIMKGGQKDDFFRRASASPVNQIRIEEIIESGRSTWRDDGLGSLVICLRRLLPDFAISLARNGSEPYIKAEVRVSSGVID